MEDEYQRVTDGQTDRQTDGHATYSRFSIAGRDKSWILNFTMLCFGAFWGVLLKFMPVFACNQQYVFAKATFYDLRTSCRHDMWTSCQSLQSPVNFVMSISPQNLSDVVCWMNCFGVGLVSEKRASGFKHRCGSSVCLSPKCVRKKNAIFSKTKQFRATVSIDDLYRKSYMGFSMNPLLDP